MDSHAERAPERFFASRMLRAAPALFRTDVRDFLLSVLSVGPVLKSFHAFAVGDSSGSVWSVCFHETKGFVWLFAVDAEPGDGAMEGGLP